MIQTQQEDAHSTHRGHPRAPGSGDQEELPHRTPATYAYSFKNRSYKKKEEEEEQGLLSLKLCSSAFGKETS